MVAVVAAVLFVRDGGISSRGMNSCSWTSATFSFPPLLQARLDTSIAHRKSIVA